MGVAVEIPSDSLEMSASTSDDGEYRTTNVTLGGGAGAYGRVVHVTGLVPLDCYGGTVSEPVEGDVKFRQAFEDYGGQVDHQTTVDMHVGVRGGYIRETGSYIGSTLAPAVVDSLFGAVPPDSTFSYYYFNPYFSLERNDWGFGLGVVVSDNRLWTGTEEYGEHDDYSVYPTGHIRLGDLQKAYFSLSLWEGVPIYSGGGRLVGGIGVRPAPWLELWGGMAGGGPYTNEGIIGRANVDVGRHLTLGASIRVKGDADEGFAPDFSEYGTSFSLTYKFVRD
jgi:hypothetical protein